MLRDRAAVGTGPLLAPSRTTREGLTRQAGRGRKTRSGTREWLGESLSLLAEGDLTLPGKLVRLVRGSG